MWAELPWRRRENPDDWSMQPHTSRACATSHSTISFQPVSTFTRTLPPCVKISPFVICFAVTLYNNNNQGYISFFFVFLSYEKILYYQIVEIIKETKTHTNSFLVFFCIAHSEFRIKIFFFVCSVWPVSRLCVLQRGSKFFSPTKFLTES